MNTPVIGIGASAGGLEALTETLGRADRNANLAFVIVQHLDPNHQSMLAELLSRQTGLHVRQIDGGEHIEPGNVYIIPPGKGLEIHDGQLRLVEFRQSRGLRRPIDDFFVSLAKDQKENAACVILSGTGADGASGLRAIKELGGVSVAQEPGTAKYDGMPLSAVGTGLVDFVLPPQEVVGRLATYFERRAERGGAASDPGEIATHIDSICVALRDSVGHDFKGYKRPTLTRRIERRMQVLGIEEPALYLKRLQADPEECECLFRDLLIHVTRFFRDPEMFASLRRNVISPLVRETNPRDEIRVWVPGCSSGEEAFSIAMMLAAECQVANNNPYIQVFATDIDQRMLNIARQGRYPVSNLADIPEHYREQYTIGHEHGFDIASSIRDMVRFSAHSLVKDPPFSRVDLISCRNLLIYFDDSLQQAVLPIFHYALKPDRYLFLGPSESVSRQEELFAPIDQPSKLFRRTDARTGYPLHLPAAIERQRQAAQLAQTRRRAPDADPAAYMRRVLERYGPATLLVDQDGAILNSSGKLSKYFEFGGSHQTRPVYAPAIARPGLKEVLLPTIRRALDAGVRIVTREVDVLSEIGSQSIELIADPQPDNGVLLVFRDRGPFQPADDDDLQELGKVDGQVAVLEDELRQTRHRLRSTVEELETANEELKSSNEEMMSMNEELQSTNEELSTVNDELKNKVDQLIVANADLRNFMDAAELAVIVLDRHGAIRSFTSQATAVFPLTAADRGRRLRDVARNLPDEDFNIDVEAVLKGGASPPRPLTTNGGKTAWSMRVAPYKSADGGIEGAIVVFVDVTTAVRMREEVEEQRRRLEMAVAVAGIGVWDYNVETGEVVLNEIGGRIFDLEDERLPTLTSILERIHPEDRERVRDALERKAGGGPPFDEQFRVCHRDGAVLWVHALARLLPDARGRRILGVSYDVTPDRQVEDMRELMLREMNHRVKNLFAVISSMIGRAAAVADSTDDLARDLRARIGALGRAHLLTQTSGEGGPVTMRELVEAVLEPFVHSGMRLKVNGPAIPLPVRQITPLALIFHEWATNASKYGAFSGEAGDLGVQWELEPDGRVMLRWTERVAVDGRATGGASSKMEGFGAKLVATSVRQLEGEHAVETDGRSRAMRLLFPVGPRPGDSAGLAKQSKLYAPGG